MLDEEGLLEFYWWLRSIKAVLLLTSCTALRIGLDTWLLKNGSFSTYSSFFFNEIRSFSLSANFISVAYRFAVTFFSLFSRSARVLCKKPLSSLRFLRQIRALLRFLSRRYSSLGRNFRIEINEALLTRSTSNTKSPTLTISSPTFLGAAYFSKIPPGL